MSYFNYIFIAAYRSYQKYESGARFSAVILIFALVVGFICVLSGISKKIWGLNPFLMFIDRYPIIIYVVGVPLLFLLNYYFSQQRTDVLNEEFENKPPYIRRLWGWIAVLSIVIPYSLMIYLGISTSPKE